MMAPVISPIAAHGKMLREEFGNDVKIVSITPCLAESVEVLHDERTCGYIDAVISFKELIQWMDDLKIDVRKVPDTSSPAGVKSKGQRYVCGRGRHYYGAQSQIR